MPTIDRLPTEDDGVEGLLAFAETFGLEETYRFFSILRDNRPGIALEARTQIAKAIVDSIREGEGLDGDEARREAAARLGYSRTTRTHFYKILDGGRLHDVARSDTW